MGYIGELRHEISEWIKAMIPKEDNIEIEDVIYKPDIYQIWEWDFKKRKQISKER